MLKVIRGIHSVCKQRTFLLLTVAQVLILTAILLFGNVKYEVSDDFMMEMILSGTYTGEYDVHIMFSNVIWASVLIPFYRLFPDVSWYLVGQLVLCLLSYVAISFVFAKALSWKNALTATVLLTAFTAMDLYILPQFTKTAVMAVMAGSLLFLWAAFSRKHLRYLVSGGVLVLVGSWVRFDTIYIAAPFVAFVLVHETFRVLRENSSSIGMWIRQVYLPGFLLVGLVFSTMLINDWVYSMDGEYQYFREYCAARSAVVDYHLPEYEVLAEKLTAIGVSENDYQMILNWNFGDSDFFDLDKLNQISAVLQQHRGGQLESVWEILLGAVSRKQVFYPGALCCMLLGLFMIVQDRRKIWIPVTLAMMILAFFAYYHVIGRKVYRVEFGYFMCAAVCMCFFFPTERCPARSWQTTAVTFLSAVMLLSQLCCYIPDQSFRMLDSVQYRDYVDSTFYRSWDYSAQKYKKTIIPGAIRPQFILEVQNHPENLYILDFNTTVQTLYYDFSPFQRAAKNFPENLVYLGGVTVNHPSVVTDRGGNGDLLMQLGQQNVFLVSNGTSGMILKYLQAHGEPDAKMELYQVIDGYQIWKYTF